MARRSEPVLVIGLGRFGFSLCRELLRQRIAVTAIDRDYDQVQRAADYIPHVLTGDCTEEAVLREAGVMDFSRVVVAIGVDQQSSILTTSILSDLGIPEIWARALGRRHASILSRVGAHHVVQPEADMGERVAHLIGGRVQEYLELDANWALVRTQPPRGLIGIPLGESALRRRRGITVVSVRPSGTGQFQHADAQTVLNAGDDVLVVGKPTDIDDFLESR